MLRMNANFSEIIIKPFEVDLCYRHGHFTLWVWLDKKYDIILKLHM